MALSGKETVNVTGPDALNRPSGETFPTTTASIVNLDTAPLQFTSNTSTGAATLSAANILGTGTYNPVEVDLAMTGTLGAGHALTMPTVAALVAAMPNPVATASYKLRIINRSSGNFAWTVTTNTGWTLTGTMTIAQNTWRDFVVTLTSATAAVLQAVGIGTDS